MLILSIDIGIKNLAFCLFEKTNEDSYFKIKLWDIINLAEDNEIKMCCVIEKNKTCNKVAKYYTNDGCFCLKHSKKQPFQLPTNDLKLSFINKQNLQKLINIADKYSLQYEKPAKKNSLINIITEYINNKCFKEITTKNAASIDLITIGKNIKKKFNNIFLNEDKMYYVIIENQISPLANRMKTIQGMIAQYFIMNDSANVIEFVSAINKLKECNIPPKTTYKIRKTLGIQKCLEILNTDCKFEDKKMFFMSHNKKDDLSDCFLQGMWFINNKL